MDKTIVHRRAASGNGNIRKKTVTSKGKQYTVWEGRITTSSPEQWRSIPVIFGCISSPH